MLLVLVGAMASPARAGQTIQFDPNGALGGGPGTVGVVTFDEDPGNALITNGVGAPNGRIVDVYYQATITSLKDATSTAVVNYGAAGNVTGTLTITAHFRETIVSTTMSGTASTVTLSGVGVAQPASEVNIYYNPANGGANNLLGTGFVGPTLIYTGTANQDANGTFTTPDTGTQALDQFSANNYPGLLSVPGAGPTGGQQASGGTTLSVQTVSFNTDFFKTNLTGASLGLFFNTSNIQPFHQVDPESVTYNGIPAAGAVGTAGVGGTIGPINGLSGPNQLLQSDAASSFEPLVTGVPEPGTAYAALIGIGLSFLAGFRAKRQRNKPSAV